VSHLAGTTDQILVAHEFVVNATRLSGRAEEWTRYGRSRWFCHIMVDKRGHIVVNRKYAQGFQKEGEALHLGGRRFLHRIHRTPVGDEHYGEDK